MDLNKLLSLCRELDSVINCEKSDLVPSQQITCLGILLESVDVIVFPIDPWFNKFREMIEHFMFLDSPPA